MPPDVLSALAQLDDLGLALLICLVGEQHCIIRAPEHLLHDVATQIHTLASEIFSLKYASVPCTPETPDGAFLDAFAQDEEDVLAGSGSNGKVIVAANLNQASYHVQIEALELMRISRGKAQHRQQPKRETIIFIALLSDSTAGPPFMIDHLNDHFFMLHDVTEYTFSSQQGRPKRPAYTSTVSSASLSSLSSVIIRRDRLAPSASTHYNDAVQITHDMIANIRAHTDKVRSSAEIRRYIHNIITFLRLHRAVAGGVSALAARNLPILARILAVLHSLNYIPPNLVGLATRKVFAHRIEVASPDTERSMQWGSDYDAVTNALNGITPERILEEVLASVECPL